MAKSILIVGNFSTGALEHQYVKNLISFGWTVYTFDIQAPVQKLKNQNLISKIKFKITPRDFYSNVNSALLSFSKKLQPLVTLVFKGMEIFPETLKEIKTCSKLLCNYNPDHPFKFYSSGSGNRNVKDSIKIYDMYGSYSEKIALELKSIYQINAFTLPFGYDADIAISRNLKPIDKFGFIGAFDKERQTILKQLSSFPIEVYGEQKWVQKLKPDTVSQINIIGKPLFDNEYANYCSASFGVFNFLRPHNILENSHNMRTFEVPGYGGLLIANRTAEQSVFFEEDKEAIYFDDIIELKERLTYFSHHPLEINRLKQNALKRAQSSNYSYNKRVKTFSNLLNEYL